MGIRSTGWRPGILYSVVWEGHSITVLLEQKPEESDHGSHVAEGRAFRNQSPKPESTQHTLEKARCDVVGREK